MVDVSQRIAVSGMLANQRQLDVVANNLANVNTTGFKKAVAHTTDIGYQAGLTAPVGPGGTPVRLQGIGEGTQLADINHDFLPGALQATGNPLDIAGALEGGNVDMADEFTRLIQAQRGYQLSSKVVQAWDDVERMANELRSA